MDCDINQRIELEETKHFIEKMKSIEEMEIEAIKAEQTKHLRLMQEEEIKKEIEYRESLMMAENSNRELEEMVGFIKKELEALKERESAYLK
jgi:hypothetical protein